MRKERRSSPALTIASIWRLRSRDEDQVDINGDDESTIDHYTVFISSDGMNLPKLNHVPSGTHTFDLSQLSLSPATYFIYVKGTGKPGIQNKMSPAIAYHAADQPSGIELKMSQTGPLMYTASTAGSSGNIARSQMDFGDGTIVSGPSASHTYAGVGTYLVTASMFDSAGAAAVAVQQISAKPRLPRSRSSHCRTYRP